eukprot:CAMPEP_0194406048 /NCGR_PEP_ID=MMETSP0176-20130528/4361_1 /TAXON_ID=216777 /ORGANISM="Proboscia alata, Strain PI-D3" /LENGTH=715 /DNA_ID=CAMNT_0039205135 /DNA_START=33 /DNA_END=2180 /DNA_ORIENTATION=+
MSEASVLKKLKDRLSKLTNAPSKETIQSLSKWVTFQRKHQKAISNTLLDEITKSKPAPINTTPTRSTRSSSTAAAVTTEAWRKMVYMAVVHEILILDVDHTKNWGKNSAFRDTLGSVLIEPAIAAVILSCEDDGETEKVLAKLTTMISAWEGLNCFDDTVKVVQKAKEVLKNPAAVAECDEDMPDVSDVASSESTVTDAPLDSNDSTTATLEKVLAAVAEKPVDTKKDKDQIQGEQIETSDKENVKSSKDIAASSIASSVRKKDEEKIDSNGAPDQKRTNDIPTNITTLPVAAAADSQSTSSKPVDKNATSSTTAAKNSVALVGDSGGSSPKNNDVSSSIPKTNDSDAIMSEADVPKSEAISSTKKKVDMNAEITTSSLVITKAATVRTNVDTKTTTTQKSVIPKQPEPKPHKAAIKHKPTLVVEASTASTKAAASSPKTSIPAPIIKKAAPAPPKPIAKKKLPPIALIDSSQDLNEANIPQTKITSLGTELLTPCKQYSSMQIAREIHHDAVERTSSIIESGVSNDILEYSYHRLHSSVDAEDDATAAKAALAPTNINIVQQQIENTRADLNQLPELPEDVLDLDLKEALNVVNLYKAALLKQRDARRKCLIALIQSRCDFGSKDAAEEFYRIGELLTKVQKKKVLLSDAMDLEGLDIDDYDGGGGNSHGNGNDDDDDDDLFGDDEGRKEKEEEENMIDWYKPSDSKRAKLGMA